MAATYTREEWVELLHAGNRRALAQAITLIESSREEDYLLAEEILSAILCQTGNALRIAVTGPPGVGKSSFIEAYGKTLLNHFQQLAVLTIDPASTTGAGAILGDKTRMMDLSQHPKAFIRPSTAAGAAGGVSKRLRENILLLEAAGFDAIIIETVGVGQSDHSVWQMTDLTLMLLQPGSGDELQSIKMGSLELADILCVTKADGENRQAAVNTAEDYRQGLAFRRPRNDGWMVKVHTCSAHQNTGIKEIVSSSIEYHKTRLANGRLEANRRRQRRLWFSHAVEENLQKQLLQKHRKIEDMHNNEAIASGEMLPIKHARIVTS